MAVKDIMTIGVIGAGVMGQEVSYQFSKYNYNVILIDTNNQTLEDAKRNIRNIARLDAILNLDKNLNISDLLAGIVFSENLSLISKADFIVENITENINEKELLYNKLKDIISDETFVSVNTSAVSITKMSSLLNKPENVLGIHFMNPVHLKPTVEVIRGLHTSEKTIKTALNLLKKINMSGIIVNDFPGFISNRVLMVTINEAIFALEDGVAKVEDIDKIFRECFGHKMGPLETCDLIGCDTILNTLDVLYESFKDTKYKPAPLLKKMVKEKLLGRKKGKGFYTYTNLT